MIYASHSLEVDAFPGKKKTVCFPPTGLTSVTVMERSLGFAESLCSDRDTPPTNLVVFSRHSAPLIFKQYLRVLPCDSAVSGAAPPSILEFSTFPSSVSPAPFRRILRLRIFAATRNTPSTIYRCENNPRNFRAINLSSEMHLPAFVQVN